MQLFMIIEYCDYLVVSRCIITADCITWCRLTEFILSIIGSDLYVASDVWFCLLV